MSYEHGYEDGLAGRGADEEFASCSDYAAGFDLGKIDAKPAVVKTGFSVVIPGVEKRIEIFIGSEDEKEANAAEARRKADRYIFQGYKVVWDSGLSEWINVEAEFDLEKKDYIWHEDGNRVRCRRIHWTKTADGTLTGRHLRKSWRRYDDVA